MSWAFQPLLEAALSNASPSVSLNTPSDASSASDTTPTFDFTGTDPEGNDITYQLQIDTVNTFDSLDQYSDIYAFGNNNTSSVLDITGAAAGQSFAGNGLVLKSATVQLHKNNSPTGNIYAKIYAHTGTFGTSSVPTGTALATSDAFGAATVPGSQSNITFTFSGANKITLENGTYYCLSIEYDGDATNNISLYYDNASPTHPGNNFYYFGGWNAQSAHDVGFVVNTERPLINKVSSLNTGFVNPDVGGDTDPFVSGDNIQYTIQSSEDILTNAQDSEGSSFGFGEFANVRYRGQRFTPLIDGEITTIGFSRNKGSQGIKVYFDTVTSNAPTNSVGSELYSFTITNANVIDEYGEYVLPTPLAVTGGTEYCFYIAPWDTSGNTYADDYQDVRGVSVTGGGEITNTGGTWSMENLTLHYRVYLTVDDTLAYDTYYWRVRGKDPSGTNEWGDWSTTRSFVVDASLSINVSDGILITESIKHILETNINKSDSITVTESSKMLLESKIETSESVIINEGTDRVVNGDFETGSGTTNANFSVPGWSVTIPANATVVSVDTTVAYSGVQSIKIAVDAGNSNNGIKQATAFTVKPDTTYIFSAFVKADTTGTMQVQFSDAAGTNYVQTNGTTWNSTPTYQNISSIPNEWMRYTFTFTTAAGQTGVRISDFKRAGSTPSNNFYIDKVEIYGFEKVELNSDIRVSDSTSITENVLNQIDLNINKSDSVTVTENVLLDIPENITVSDTITVTENFLVQFEVPTNSLSVSDSIAVSESLSLAVSAPQITVNDTATITELLKLELNNFINVSDSIAITENTNLLRISDIRVSDTIGTSESISVFLEIKVNVSDTISTSELVNVALVHGITVSDSVSVAENLKIELNAFVNVYETLNAAENVSVDLTITPRVSDTIGTSEGVKVLLVSDINVSDTISTTENIIVVNALDYLTTSDTINVNESAIVVLLGTALNPFATDSVSVSESINVAVSAPQVVASDSISVTEFFDPEVEQNIRVNDKVSVQEGRYGTALNFNGTTQYIRRNSPSVFANSGYSIEFWVKGSPNAASNFIYGEGNTASNNTKIGIRTSSTPGNQNLNLFIRNDAGSTLINAETTTLVLDGAWHHILFTDNNGTAAMYIDGIQDATSFNYTFSGVFTLTDTAVGAMYGNGGGGSAASQFAGRIDQVRTYATTLTLADAVSLYHNGNPPSTPYFEWFFNETTGNTTVLDSSGNGRNGDLTGHAPTYTTDIPYPLLKLERESNIALNDIVIVGENVQLSIGINLTTSDNISVSENAQVQLGDVTISVSDTIGTAESVNVRFPDTEIYVSDTITINESVNAELIIFINVSDSITVTDIVSTELNSNIRVSDTIGTAENVVVERPYLISVSDTIGTNESVTVTVSAPQITVSDIITTTENNNMAYAHVLSVSDSISVSEFVLLTPPHVPDYILPKLIMVEGRLAYLVVPNIGLPHYIFIT